MSHFAILATVPSGKSLQDVMLPYHEYESTGIEKFVEFVVESDDIIDEHFKKYGEEYPSLENFIEEYMGLTYSEEHKGWGRFTNPNSRWDWYEVGGRWRGYFGDKDYGMKSELGVETARIENLTRVMDAYDRFWEARNKAIPSAEQVAEAAKFIAEREYVKKHWSDPEVLACDMLAVREAEDSVFFGFDDILDYKRDREEYASYYAWKAPIHAFIDSEGVWHERGTMGWFAMCDDENKSEYDGEYGKFWSFYNGLKDGTMLALVDCHI